MTEERTKQILFVCTANICRSPMAEAIFNALTEDQALPFRAQSAGTSDVKNNERIAPNAKLVLKEIGIYEGGHRARQVKEDILAGADLILTMSPQHRAELDRLYSGISDKIHTLTDFTGDTEGRGEVADPYGHSMIAYRACFRHLLQCIDLLIKRLMEPEIR